MDGTFAGDGPGPRCMIPHVKNVILASADQVARGRAAMACLKDASQARVDEAVTAIAFLLAIIAMIALTSGKRAKFLGAPAALGIPYFREER